LGLNKHKKGKQFENVKKQMLQKQNNKNNKTARIIISQNPHRGQIWSESKFKNETEQKLKSRL
jgi:hypothetical protein